MFRILRHSCVMLRASTRYGAHKNPRHHQNLYSTRSEVSRTLSSFFLGSIPIITFSLGCWQIKRLSWKLDLIEKTKLKLDEEPTELPTDVNSYSQDLEYRKVLITGYYEEEKTILLGPKMYEGAHGFYMVTPFVRKGDGTRILVNRGFVSNNRINRFAQSGDRTEIKVLGLLRKAPRRHWSTPENRPDEGEWFWLDLKTVLCNSERNDRESFTEFYVEEVFLGDPGDVKARLAQGIPIGRAPSVDFRNTHATYAFIWFALASLTGGMFLYSSRQKYRSMKRLMPTR